MASSKERKSLEMDRKQILDLPNECLIVICRDLSLNDLISVGATCTRLKAIAFCRRPANKIVNVKQFQQAAGLLPLRPRNRIDWFFLAFGDSLVDVTIDSSRSDFRQEAFQLMTKHCCDGALKAFRGRWIKLKSPHSAEMRRLFSGLKIIQLNVCKMVEDVFSVSQECQELVLYRQSLRCGDIDLMSSLHFPKLRSLDI